MNYHLLLQQESVQVFGINLINTTSLAELLVRFTLNFIVIFIVVRLIYFYSAKQREYYFAFIMMSTIVFLMCFMLGNAKLQMGIAFGMFAIFSIIRYRTILIPIREMTYLFLVLGISVINALAGRKMSYADIIAANTIVVIIIWSSEYVYRRRREGRKYITYESTALVHPDKREELIADLKKRTGLDITRVEIGNINYLRDSVKLLIYFKDGDSGFFEEGYDDFSD